MKIFAANSNYNLVSGQNKYNPISKGKFHTAGKTSVIKKAVIPTFAIAAAALMSGCSTKKYEMLKEEAKKERKEVIAANLQGDTINNKAYNDAVEFGNIQQAYIEYKLISYSHKSMPFKILTSRLKSLLQTATSPESEGGINLTLNEKAVIDGVIRGGSVPASGINYSATKDVHRQQMQNRALHNFK